MEKRFDAETLKQVIANKPPLWIDITNPTTEDIKVLSSLFGLHQIVCDDCLSPDTQPKVEYFGSYMHLVVSSLMQEGQHLKVYEIDFIKGEWFVMSIHTPRLKQVDDFLKNTAQVEHELRKGVDHIMHYIVDMLVDNFFPVVENLEEELDLLEQSVIKHGSHRELVHRLLKVKKDILLIRKVSFPQREVLSLLTRERPPFINREIAIYFRDDYDRMMQVHNSIEQNREIAAMVLQVQQAVTANRLNEIMKVLAGLAIIFAPVALISSMYGMNFRYMPELEWKYGYFMALVLMFATSGLIYWWFRRKKWV